MRFPKIPARSSPTAPIAAITSATPSAPGVVFRASSRPACGAVIKPRRCKSSKIGTSRSTGYVAGSRRSSAHGNEAMVCAGCDGAGLPKPPAKSTSPPSLTTSNAHSTFCTLPDDAEADQGRSIEPTVPTHSQIMFKKRQKSVLQTYPRTGLLGARGFSRRRADVQTKSEFVRAALAEFSPDVPWQKQPPRRTGRVGDG